MSTWGYVLLGWISTYAVIAGWLYSSRMPAEVQKDDEIK